MSTDEIICLSSEDDDGDRDKVKCNIQDSSIRKNGNTNECHTKKRQLPSPVVAPVAKRINLISSVKTNTEDTESDEVIEVIGVIAKKEKSSGSSSSLVTDFNKKDSDAITSAVHESEKNTPLLVVKEKHPVHSTCGRQDVFSMFISQCLQRNKSADMRKIVDKLKRKYEQLDPCYAQSQEFEDLLNEKRDCLMSENGTVYRHISEINSEMKKWKNNKNPVSIPTCSSSAKNFQNRTCDENGDEEEEDLETIRKHNNKIKSIERAMQIVEKRIKKYEEADVDLDDDTNSNFLISERYKKRMVELYVKWCELTGNHKDAGRTYLRPVHLKLTGIVNVDQAINSFINSKFNKKKNSKNILASSNNLVFPDFIDIFNLIHAHNVAQKLGMDTRAEKSTAKAAFLKLGEYLKCERQKDFYDTFSYIYEQNDDPATKHAELMAKLRENRDLGEKNLNAIFDEYCKKQEIAKSVNANQTNADDTENEDETSNEGDDEFHVNGSDSDICHDSDATIKNLKDSSDDEAIIINHISDESNNTTELDKVITLEKTTESTASETQSSAEISILSVNNNFTVDNKDNIAKFAISNDKMKGDNDMKMPTSEISSSTSKSITSSTQAIINELDVKQNDVDDESTDLSAKTVRIEKPLLKLRSFAKSPEFWKNSQESKNEIPDKWNDSIANQKHINEVIELETVDKEIPRIKINNCVDKNITTKQSSSNSRQLTSIPLTLTNKDVKIFRRCITIPALKLTPISKSNVELTNSLSIDKNVMIQSKFKTMESSDSIPPSAIESCNVKTTRRIAHIGGQQKLSATPTLKNKTDIVSRTSNPHGSQTWLINPITKSANVLPKTISKPLSATNIKNISVVNRNDSVIDLEVKSTPQKVINPLVKHQLQQQENIQKMMNKISEYNNDVTITGSPFISI